MKVLWDARVGDFTWELEETIGESYSHLFPSQSIFEDENFSYWRECNNLENLPSE